MQSINKKHTHTKLYVPGGSFVQEHYQTVDMEYICTQNKCTRAQIEITTNK